jgi:hypothetical protein
VVVRLRWLALSTAALLLLGCSGDTEGGAPDEEPQSLDADFEWDYDLTQTAGTACSFSTTHFLDRSTGDPTSWLWEFPDGSTSTEENPVVDTLHTRVVPADGVANMSVTLTVGRNDELDSTMHEVIPVHC